MAGLGGSGNRLASPADRLSSKVGARPVHVGLEHAKNRYSKSLITLKNRQSVLKLPVMGAGGMYRPGESASRWRNSGSFPSAATLVSDQSRGFRADLGANLSARPCSAEAIRRPGFARVHSAHRPTGYDAAASFTAAVLRDTLFLSSSTRRPITSWADVVEAYRPVAMANSRWRRTRRPKVSLCIYACQTDRHLQATIESCVAQNYPALELVIIDNDSSDHARHILETVNDERVRVIRCATTGPIADKFNMAVQQSNGQFVKLICAGDVLRPDCIAKQAKLLEDNPDVALVAVRTDHIDDDGNLLSRGCGLAGLIGRHSGERAIRRMARSNVDPIGPTVSGLFRRLDFDQCGGCRGDLLFPMDMGLWIRLLGQGDFLGVPDTLASSRKGSGLMTQHSRRDSNQAPGRGDHR
jgi:hypothetical protein